jgi:sugar O-acyltransferase (sialic acid O-acetyltransferase NeuD family)
VLDLRDAHCTAKAIVNPLIIFGTGDIAELADFYFRNTAGRQVAAFTVDAAYVKEERWCDRPVVAFEELVKRFPPAGYELFVALSYSKMNNVREAKAAAGLAHGYRLASYISPRATVFTDRIGHNCFILEDNTIQPFVSIGHNVTLWSGNHIGHHSTIEDNVFISSHVVVSGGVRVGRNSFVGVNATIADHVAIAPYTLIGAGTIVLENTEAEGVYVSTAVAQQRKAKSTRLPKF